MADSGSGGRSTKLATTSRWPSSTAESSAKATASGSNGTSSVASMTGRPVAAPRSLAARGSARSSAGMNPHCPSLRMQLPFAQAPRLLPDPPSPPGHVEQEPEAHHDREQNQDPDSGHDRQDHDRDDDPQRGGEHGDAQPSHIAHDPPVLLGRDLPGVPAAMAGGAHPPLAVRNVSDPSAVAADGDQGTAHARIVGLPGSPGQIPARARGGPVLAGLHRGTA